MRALSLVCLTFLLGCGGAGEPEPAPLFVQAEALEWRAGGGGKLYFDVRRGARKDFSIEGTPRDFRPVDKTVILTGEKSLPVYDLVTRVFAGKENLSGIATPDRNPTGTWTSVYVIDHEKQRHKVGSSHLRGELHDLRYWVEAQLAAEATATESSSARQPPGETTREK
jgi:hypothetical protein